MNNDRDPDGWTSECPTQVGVWEYKADDFTGSRRREFDLEEFEFWHNSLTNPQWRPHKLAGSETPETDALVDQMVDSEASPTYEEDDLIEMTAHARQLETRLAVAEAKVKYAENHGLHIAVGTSTDCPEGRLQHSYIAGSTLSRMFDEWSHGIGMGADLTAWKALAGRLGDALEESGECLACWVGDQPHEASRAVLQRAKDALAELGRLREGEK